MTKQNGVHPAISVRGLQAIDVYTHHRRPWMRRFAMEQRENKYGIYFHTELSGRRKKRLLHKLSKKGIKYRLYEKQYTRSGYYRTLYFNHNEPPYRCLYCGKRLRREDVTIDHIIPVGLSKTSRRARRILHRRGCASVNDLGNLASCCYRCNQKKGNRMGIWLLRAHPAWRVFKRLIIIAVILTAAYLLNRYGVIRFGEIIPRYTA